MSIKDNFECIKLFKFDFKIKINEIICLYSYTHPALHKKVTQPNNYIYEKISALFNIHSRSTVV